MSKTQKFSPLCLPLWCLREMLIKQNLRKPDPQTTPEFAPAIKLKDPPDLEYVVTI